MTDTINLQATFFMDIQNQEVAVTIAGQVIRGADAARDECGRPTECATAPDAFATYICVDGKEITDDEAVILFDISLEDWEEICYDELMDALNEYDHPTDYSDDLPF
jgi:hypothetical protein